MSAKEIADGLVEAGVIDCIGNHREMSRPGYTELGRFYYPPNDDSDGFTADDIVNDWRVAGACLERMEFDALDRALDFDLEWLRDPAAICEAFVQARKHD